MKKFMFTILMFLPIYAMETKKEEDSIVIRTMNESDFNQFVPLAVPILSTLYKKTEEEQINQLKYKATAMMQQDSEYFCSHRENMIALVAETEKKIIGMLTANFTEKPNELYIRTMMIDTSFQNKELGTNILKECYRKVPDLKSVYCVTNKKNNKAQEIYEHLGGKKVENPDCLKYLYSCLNPSDFIGYEFNQSIMNRFASKD